jgi:hypothetical protein
MEPRVPRWLYAVLILAFATIAYVALIAFIVYLVDEAPTSGDHGQYIRELLFITAFVAAPSVLAAMLLARAWWTRSGARLSLLDGPGRLLAVAVGTLPAERREWAAAMEAELAGVQGRPARWRFAVSAARTASFPPPSGRRPIVVASAAAVVLIVATSLSVGRAVPELHVFAWTFTALASAAAVLALARGRRIAPSPAIAAIVCAAVAGCIAATVYLLRQDPSGAAALRPVHSVLLAIVLVGSLWLALTPPRALMTSRSARGLGVGLGFALGAGFLWSSGFPGDTGAGVMGFVMLGTIVAFSVGSGLAALIDGSFRSGVQTAVWGGTIGVLLMFGIWLVEAVRWHEAGAGFLLDGDQPSTIAANLTDAVFWVFIFVSIWALPFGVFGAALGARRRNTSPPAPSVLWAMPVDRPGRH